MVLCGNRVIVECTLWAASRVICTGGIPGKHCGERCSGVISVVFYYVMYLCVPPLRDL